jgi:hypothetical protein
MPMKKVRHAGVDFRGSHKWSTELGGKFFTEFYHKSVPIINFAFVGPNIPLNTIPSCLHFCHEARI